MIRKLFAIAVLFSVLVSCKELPVLKNQTEPVGYALGEKVGFSFAASNIKNPPDSIAVFVLEKKSGYEYLLWAKKADSNEICRYSTLWDGRKPDGSWPMGGRYLVHARLSEQEGVYSDTIQIGLGD
jgi:hypothetical protein